MANRLNYKTLEDSNRATFAHLSTRDAKKAAFADMMSEYKKTAAELFYTNKSGLRLARVLDFGFALANEYVNIDN